MADSSTPDAEGDDGETFTSETDVRIKWLGSILATFIIVSFFALIFAIAFGYASFEPISSSAFMILGLLVLAAGTWTFGIDLIDKYTGK